MPRRTSRGFKVERSADAVNFTQVGTPAANATSYADSGLDPATSYSYRVRAYDAESDSPYSAAAGARTPVAGTLFVDQFDDATLGPDWSTYYSGTWQQAGGVLSQTGLGGPDIKKAAVTGVAFPADVEVTARVRVDTWAGGEYARAGVSLGGDDAGKGYNLLFHRDTNTVEFLHDGVAWGNRYAFAWQVGTWYHFTLQQKGGILRGKVWADGQAEPASWMFRQGGWASRAGAPGLNGGSYAGATASFDDFSVAVASAASAVPPTPVNLVAYDTSSAQVTLTWTGSVEADSYRIERSPDGTSGWSQVGTAADATWQDSGLAAATTYHYRVRALNEVGLSSSSAAAIARTPAAGTPFVDHFESAALGPVWSIFGGDWEQAGGVVSQTGLGSGDPKKVAVTGMTFPADVEVTARVRVDTWAGGDSARAGVSVGNEEGRGYNLLFHGDTNTVQFLHDNVAWGNSYAFAWQVGSWYHFKLRQEGGSSRVRSGPTARRSRRRGCSSRTAGPLGWAPWVSTGAPMPARPPASTTSRCPSPRVRPPSRRCRPA